MNDILPHSDWHGFVTAICLDPDDDTPRLVAADWLEEQGENERAELIRIQVEIARTECGHASTLKRFNPGCHRCALVEYQQLLCSTHDFSERMLGNIQTGKSALRNWSRGFIGEMKMTADEFVRQAIHLFANHPITQIQLTDKVPLDTADDLGLVAGRSIRFRWLRETPRWLCFGQILHSLPVPIWSHLRGGGASKDGYATEIEALRDLSRACVDWGREAAGLPPLTERTDVPLIEFDASSFTHTRENMKHESLSSSMTGWQVLSRP